MCHVSSLCQYTPGGLDNTTHIPTVLTQQMAAGQRPGKLLYTLSTWLALTGLTLTLSSLDAILFISHAVLSIAGGSVSNFSLDFGLCLAFWPTR